VKGYLLVVTAVALCPCHLPLLGAIFAGTALGAGITDNYGVLYPLLGLYFVGALFFGIRWMTRGDTPSCVSCEDAPSVSQPQDVAPNATPAHIRGG